jgi:hypothetical protein
MYHPFAVDWPCLSFDFIKDSLGHFRTKFPLTCYMVAGTQSSVPAENKVMLLKMSDIHKTVHDNEEDSDGALTSPLPPPPRYSNAAPIATLVAHAVASWSPPYR